VDNFTVLEVYKALHYLKSYRSNLISDVETLKPILFNVYVEILPQ
jgi:hypothetical protein